VASASLDKIVNVWNPNTWSSVRIYTNHSSPVYGLDQIDHDTIVSGSRDRTIRIWKISTGETLRVIDTGLFVSSVKVLLNRNEQIVCGLEGLSDNLRVYNFSSGILIKTLIGHTSYIYSTEILSERFIASGSYETNVLIWDLETYSVKFNLTGHARWVFCVKRLSSNLLASGDESGLIKIWDWVTGVNVHTLIGHNSSIYLSSLDLYDEQTLISGSWDRTVKFWNITNGALIKSIETDFEVIALAMFKSSFSELFMSKN